MNLFYPVHRPTLERHGREAFKPGLMTANGPYVMTEWKVNDRKTFERNPRHRDASRTAITRFVFLSIPDAGTALRAYEAGQVHWLFQAPTDQMDRMRASPDYVAGPANAVYFFAFNTRRKPLDDPRVRKALSLAVDREGIARGILRGGETPADRLVPPSSR
jgi:oligopeptide transport system substrate-binding protein